MSDTVIGVIMGSYRRESFSRKIANHLVEQLPQGYNASFISAEKLPMYNQDLDSNGNVPLEWLDFREQLDKVDAFLFVTPEHNRSFPAVMKNALDVGSRPYGSNKWSGKPAVVVSVSPGKIGGFGANHHLRQTLVFLNVAVMPQPEAYVGEVTSMLAEDGSVASESARGFLQSVVDAFVLWIKRLS